MLQRVIHKFTAPDGREHSAILKVHVPTGPTQVVEYTDLVLLNHQGGGDVAIIRDGHMGDILLLTPTLRQLKQDLPELRLHLYCDAPYVPLLYQNPYVESCQPIPQDIATIGGDIVANLNLFVERSPEAWITDRASLFARAFGMSLRGGMPVVMAPDPMDAAPRIAFTRSQARYGATSYAPCDMVLIAPDASDPRRAMSDQLLEQVLIALDNKGIKYIVVGTERGERLSVSEAICYLRWTAGLLSVDNGMYHAAAALGKPAVVLFTTVPPALRTRWYGPSILTFMSTVVCSPCKEQPTDVCTRACTVEFDVTAITESVAWFWD